MAKNQLITELPYIGKQYNISFDLLITKFDTTEYQSVLRLTLGGNINAYGDRAPAVWVHKDKYLHVTSSINGNKNLWYNVQNVPLVENKWYKIEISQTLMDGKVNFSQENISITVCLFQYIYEVLVNGDQVYTVENTQAQKFAPVKVFAGDDFYATPEGKIRNLYVYTRHE